MALTKKKSGKQICEAGWLGPQGSVFAGAGLMT